MRRFSRRATLALGAASAAPAIVGAGEAAAAGASSVSAIADLRLLAAAAANVVFVAGYAKAGDGGHGSFVWNSDSGAADDGAFAVKPEGVGDGGKGRWLRLHDREAISTSIYGSVPDWNGTAGTDNTATIQRAINAHALDHRAAAVRIPHGRYKTTAPIHLNYGLNSAGAPEFARSLRLCGDGAPFAGGAGFTGTAIVCRFSDAPGISVQGARADRVNDLALAGMNERYVLRHGLGRLDYDFRTTGIDDLVLANWIDPALSPNANSIHAPYGGVVVDAYSHTAPAAANDKYPDVAFPAAMGSPAQYGKPYSSQVLLERLQIVGFVAGIVNKPNGDGNGDFTMMRDICILSCPIGVSIGNTQARNMDCASVTMARVHTGFSNASHGVRAGKFTTISNCHVGTAIQYFKFSSMSHAGPVTFSGAYSEELWRIGYINATTATECSVDFVEPSFDFEDQTEIRGIPAAILEANGFPVPIHFRGGLFNLFWSVALIYVNPSAVVMEGTLFLPHADQRTHPYQRFMHNLLCGGVAFAGLSYNNASSKIRPMWRAFHLDTGGDYGTQLNAGEVWLSTRELGTPLYWHQHTARLEPQAPPVALPPRTTVIDLSTLATSTLTNRTWEFTFASRDDAAFAYEGPLPGDPILIGVLRSLFIVRARTGTKVTAELQNNFRTLNGVTTPLPVDKDLQPVAPSLPVNTNAAYFANSRLYSPARAVYGTFTAKSPIVTDAQHEDGSSAYIENVMAVGDYIYFDLANDGMLAARADSRIIGLNNAARTITMAGNALKTERRRIGTLIRTPPANA